MNELKIFEHPKFGKIRTIVEDGKTLFCGLDAARALEYVDPDGAIRRHCRYPSKQRVWVQTGMKADGTPAMRETEMSFIPEGDLCRLAAKSELPGAIEFESWIFDEVIPTILRTGTYSIAPAQHHRAVEVSPAGLAKLISITRRVMLDMDSSPVDVGSMVRDVFRAYNFPIPTALSRQIEGQTSFFDLRCLPQKSA